MPESYVEPFYTVPNKQQVGCLENMRDGDVCIVTWNVEITEDNATAWNVVAVVDSLYTDDIGDPVTEIARTDVVLVDVVAPNDSPIIVSEPVSEAVVYSSYGYDVDAIDNDTLSYLLVDFPAGMSINESSGLIQWTPTPYQINSYNLNADNSVIVRVEDSKGGSDEQSFNITVHGICAETDGGINYTLRGNISGTGCMAGDCGDYTTADWCNRNIFLNELYCEYGDIKMISYSCPDGCYDGACRLVPVCSDTDAGVDYGVHGTVSYNGANYTDSCNGNTLTENYCINDVRNFEYHGCPGSCSDGACVSKIISFQRIVAG
ncbi:hypothetical protein JW968_00110 [Candidatus Woesearchaeota archaeon]|nr:hypothetical protein [Candidatus Woesearchaeota archaeon]